jgi:hypothetical protein
MGFANLLIAEITTNYSQTVERVFSLCKPLEIANKRPKTDLVFKDAKAIIYHILPEKSPKVTRNSDGETSVTTRAIFGWN